MSTSSQLQSQQITEPITDHTIIPFQDHTIIPFQESNLAQRYVLFPIKHPKIWASYKRQQNAYWTAESVDLSEDLKAYEKLTFDEQHFIKTVLAFFAASDGIVLENLAVRFMQDVQLAEARCAYGFQLAVENIHSEMYSLLIDVLIRDEVEKDKVFNAINDSNFPAIKQKAAWARKWIASDQQFGQRLVAFAVVEGVFFSGSFCAIFWLKKRQIMMPGLFESNAYISRDEGMHTDHAVLLYNMIEHHHRLSTNVIHKLVSEAVEIEEKFITEALPVNLIGMSCSLMRQYIQFVADRLLKQLGYTTLFNVSNPFEWMLTIGLAGKTNFFEGRVPDYNSAHVKSSASSCSTDTYTVMDDF